ncbi:MAG TPA: hypothetical protein VFS62_12265 [Chloroflexota bacterium]|nr:hypothetical protein [Chloroflexota bacterium]
MDSENGVSRRLFIRVAGGAVAGTGAGLLLAACGGSSAPASSAASSPAAPPSSSAARPSVVVSGSPAASAPAGAQAAPSVVGATTSSGGSALPNYIAPTFAAKPDYDAHDQRVTFAWDSYPKSPPKSWTKDPPGTGSKVTAFAVDYYPPPTPYTSNPTWQAVNKALNVDFQMTQVAGADYPLKFSTMIAGGDIPDIMHLFGGLTGASVPPGTAEFVQSQCADLTPYLSGDNVKDYPNLAAISTYAWSNSACVIQGKLYSWPIHRYLPNAGVYFFKNTDVWAQKVGADTVPKDAADLKKIMQQLNDPKNGQWAIGNIVGSIQNLGLLGYQSMFGAPQLWGMGPNGVVRDRETDQFKAAVGYIRDLWASGLIWADAVTPSINSRDNFVAKKFVMSVEGFGNSWNDFWLRGLQQKPATNFDIIYPFSADANTKVQSYISGGYISTNVMKKGSPDRIKELLRVIDYLAKPFGTQEDLLITYGLAPADYTIGTDGSPTLTSDGKNRSQYVPWQYLSDRPYATYYAGIPGYAKHVNEVETKLVDTKIAVADVTLGYYSATATSSAGKNAEQKFYDGLNSIMLGRDPLTGFDQLVKDWQTSVGNTIKKEYNDAMAAAKK